MQKVRKAVIPAAGYGTRMLPITKTISKEMLPLVDKPIIQQVVEELVEAGIEDIIMVIAPHKADINDYFGETEEGLVGHLKAAGPSKEQLLQQLESVQDMANFAFIEQSKQYGTGTPVLDAAPYLGGEPFIYTYADDFFIAKENSVKQLINCYKQYDAPVLGCLRKTDPKDFDRYGFVGGEPVEDGAVKVKLLAEKPGAANAPSQLAAMGYYLLTPDIIDYLQQVLHDLPAGREFYVTDAYNAMINDGKQMIAKEIVDAEYFDTGNKLEYMKTVTTLAARHAEIGGDYKQWLRDFADKL